MGNLAAIVGLAYFSIRIQVDQQSDALHERVKGTQEYLRKAGDLNTEKVVVKLDKIIYEHKKRRIKWGS